MPRYVIPGYALVPAGGDPPGAGWQPFREGIEIYRLSPTTTSLVAGETPTPETMSRAAAAYLRYAPSAAVPWHRHLGYEQILVIAGSQCDDAGCYDMGTMVVNPPGSAHRVWSPEGCVVLIMWTDAIEILAEPPR
jgi:ChrR Cupin-like domain